ncbi:carbohydrate porin [Duganella sp. FT80W]|uniref:Carbohydrate porin n=1 Tax=Duganella guangzhouensis TaxID=2666084 RepID=A0A6I2L0F5_9BURK|nr:carbohydrate porin [Duganella guangzhouensis]
MARSRRDGVRRPRAWARTCPAALVAIVALASPDTRADDLQTSTESSTLTGDWGGARSRYAKAGVNLRGDYVSETFANVSGGLQRGSTYAQQVRLGADFDMALLAGWSGTTLHFTINDRRGESVSADYIGNRMPVQEAAGGSYTRLSEASVEQKLLGDKLNLRLGFFAMGNDLGGMAVGCQLVNAAFCAHPLSMSGNSGWYNYPNARWGAAVRYQLQPELYLRSGVYQDNSKLGNKENAFRPFAAGTTGVVLPLELEYAPGSAPNSAALPGHYKLGALYDTAQAKRQGEAGTVGERYGVYLLADQMIVRDGATGRGLALFGQITANPQASAQITRWYAAGLVKTGTFAGRDRDTVALGVVRAQVNPRLRASAAAADPDIGGYAALPAGETVVELSYGWQPLRWLGVRADVQYIIDPGAFSYRSTQNALAIGTQLKITF